MRPTIVRFSLLFACVLVAFVPSSLRANPKLELRRGDHICLIGNTLADRMQHHGWLETLIQSRYPNLELVFRNLGFAGDGITERPRSKNFGEPDTHLAHSKADVIFAFFGYNESFADVAGLDKFRSDLGKLADRLSSQKYNGESAPRIVLFSPIGHEDLQDPSLPSGQQNNRRLALYSQAIREVAAERALPFVDLLAPTLELYKTSSGTRLTINGIHLTEIGNRRVAERIDAGLFGDRSSVSEVDLELLRQAVLDKNRHWVNRYRATDGYSQFGARAFLEFIDQQNNFVVMQRELEMLDVMTANRDKRIWAVARGGDLVVEDNNLPEHVQVKSNRPGSKDDGSYEFVSGEDAIEKMTLAPGLRAELFASEETFPELVNPVQTAVDTDGRLWVAAWPTYPHWTPDQPLNDKLVILPDEDNDGKADRCIVFADDLHNPTGFEFWGGGVLVALAPDILFLRDTDGDDRADSTVRVVQGIDSADTHHTANSFVIGPAGWLYFQRGVFHVTGVETPWGPTFRSTTSSVYRFHPRTYRIEKHFDVGVNPHGDTFDRWGYQIACDGTSGRGFYVGFPGRKAPKDLYQQRYRPVAAIGILSSEHFPESMQGDLLICNVIGFQGIARYRFIDQGAGLHAEHVEPLVVSSDPNFRPSDLEVGADGAIYFIDWHNPLIGHMQHNLRDPNRDHRHGRVYRITAEESPLATPIKMKGRTIREILGHLSSPTDSVRYRARLELSGRPSDRVLAAAQALATTLDETTVEHAHLLTELLWLHQQHDRVHRDLLDRVLRSPEPLARAAATRVLRDWRQHVSDAGERLVKLAGDEHPRVRAEAVVASVAIGGVPGAQIIFEAQRWPTDRQLDFNLTEAQKSVDVRLAINAALLSGRKLALAEESYVLSHSTVEEILRILPASDKVYATILTRETASKEQLAIAVRELTQLRETDAISIILETIDEHEDRRGKGQPDALTELLAAQPSAALKKAQPSLEQLALQGKSEVSRRAGYAGWIAADASVQTALTSTSEEPTRLRDLLMSVALVPDGVRHDLYGAVRPLLFDATGVPRELRDPGVEADYFHPRPPNALLESFADHVPAAHGIVPNVGLDVPHRGSHERFGLLFRTTIRADADGDYTFHVRSDDGSRLYVDGNMVVDNDGLHGPHEVAGSVPLKAGKHALTLTYFNERGNTELGLSWNGPDFERRPIDETRLTRPTGRTVGDLAVSTLSLVRGRESELFGDLAVLIRAGLYRESAVRVLREIDEEHWLDGDLLSLAESLAKHVSDLPPRERTQSSALDAIRLSDRLASKLPEEQRRTLQSRLADARVHVIRIGTVPHRMIFDKERLVVQAEKAVEFVFSNTDQMPHNFAIVEPGSLEEIGLLAESTAQDPDAMERHYIPKSDKVLLGSRLLQPGGTQSLSFQAPGTPGIYPYVCTYPGHWRRMYGALYVVANLKSYLDNPEDYLAAHPLELNDELLRYNDRKTEWTELMLAEPVRAMHHGRSFEVGQEIFKVANCVACHRMNDEGQEFGPDLTKLEGDKSTREHLLRSLTDPSAVIDDKYRSHVFVLDTGDVITGMITAESPTAIQVLTDPQGKAPPVTIEKSSIQVRSESTESIMPRGLLDKLSREEILDLLAYLVAKGDREHRLFASGHEH